VFQMMEQNSKAVSKILVRIFCFFYG